MGTFFFDNKKKESPNLVFCATLHTVRLGVLLYYYTYSLPSTYRMSEHRTSRCGPDSAEREAIPQQLTPLVGDLLPDGSVGSPGGQYGSSSVFNSTMTTGGGGGRRGSLSFSPSLAGGTTVDTSDGDLNSIKEITHLLQNPNRKLVSVGGSSSTTGGCGTRRHVTFQHRGEDGDASEAPGMTESSLFYSSSHHPSSGSSGDEEHRRHASEFRDACDAVRHQILQDDGVEAIAKTAAILGFGVTIPAILGEIDDDGFWDDDPKQAAAAIRPQPSTDSQSW